MSEEIPRSQLVQQAYIDVFSSPQGLMVLEDMAKAHYFHRSTFSADALTMARAEGERSVVLRIKQILDALPEQTTLTLGGTINA